MKTYQTYDCFIFLDADTKVFSPFDEMMEYLKVNEIIISPHFIRVNHKNPFYHLDITHNSGIFNTGLFGIKRGNESDRFLRWWADILLKYCYKDSKKGLWNEQKWLDLDLGLFDFYIQKDPGYNVGPWNFHERVVTITDNGIYLVDGKPLRLFHFWGLFGGYYNQRIRKVPSGQRKLIVGITKKYRTELSKALQHRFKTSSWSYNRFWSGAPIKKRSRSIYRNNRRVFKHLDNPFSKDDQYFQSSLEQHSKRNKSGKR